MLRFQPVESSYLNLTMGSQKSPIYTPPTRLEGFMCNTLRHPAFTVYQRVLGSGSGRIGPHDTEQVVGDDPGIEGLDVSHPS